MFLPGKKVYKGAFVWDTVIILNNEIVIVMYLYSLSMNVCWLLSAFFLMNWYVTSKQKLFSTNVDKFILIYRLFQSFLFSLCLETSQVKGDFKEHI